MIVPNASNVIARTMSCSRGPLRPYRFRLRPTSQRDCNGQESHAGSACRQSVFAWATRSAVLLVPGEIARQVAFEEPLDRAVLRRVEEPDSPADPDRVRVHDEH